MPQTGNSHPPPGSTLPESIPAIVPNHIPWSESDLWSQEMLPGTWHFAVPVSVCVCVCVYVHVLCVYAVQWVQGTHFDTLIGHWTHMTLATCCVSGIVDKTQLHHLPTAQQNMDRYHNRALYDTTPSAKHTGTPQTKRSLLSHNGLQYLNAFAS